MIDGLDGVMDLAAASGEDLGAVADIVTDGLSAFGLEAAESGRMADVLAAASANANTDVAGLGAAFSYVAPVAGALGFTIEDTSKAIGLMANSGIKSTKAGTALRTMMTNLAKPTASMKKEMERLGISLTDSEGNMKSFDEIMLDMRGSFSGMTEEQKASSAATIFGKEAMSGALAIINTSEEDYNKLGGAIENSGGAAKEMADIMEGQLGGTLREIKSGLEGFAISIYEEMLPSLVKVADKVKTFVGWLNDLSPAAKKTIVVFGGIAAAVGPVLIGLGTLVASLGAIITFIGSVSSATAIMGTAVAAGTPLIGGLATMFTVLTGPVGIAVAAIAAITVGTVALVSHLKKDAIPEVDRFGKGVSKSTQEALGGFMDLSEGAQEQLTEMSIKGSVVTKEMAQKLKGNFSDMNDQILAEMKTDHSTQIKEMESFYLNTNVISDEQARENIKNRKLKNKNEEIEQQHLMDSINKIIDTAYKEKRKMTQSEEDQIAAINELMTEKAIKVMSDSEVEQKAIMERMASNAEIISAKQAQSVIKESAKARDGVIKEAKKTRKETENEAIRQRDETGEITAEQAEQIIANAGKTYDETVKHAENMHKDVVTEAEKQMGSHIKAVDTETGESLSKWEVMKNGTVKFAKDMGTGIKGWFKDQWDDTKKKNKEGQKKQSEDWQNLKDDTVTKAKELGTGVKDWFKDQWKETKKKNKEGQKKQSEDWQNLKDDTIRKAKDMGTDVKKWGSDQWNDVKAKTSDGVLKVKNGWEDMKTNVKNKAEDLRKGATDKIESLRSGIVTKSTDMKNKATGLWETMKTSVIKVATDMKDKVKEKFDNIVTGAKQLPGKMKDGIVSMANQAVDGIKKVGQRMANAFGRVVNGIINGINTITGKIGVTADIPNWTVPTFAKGTDGHKGGPMIVGDKHGREIVELPTGESFVSPDTDTLLNAPKGTRVIPNKITEKYLKGDIPQFAKGTGVAGWLKDKAKGFASAVSNVWDYAKNPSKLLDLMPLPKLDGMSGAIGTILKGGLKKVKSSAVDKIKSMFEGEGGVDGGPIGKVGSKGPFPSPYRLTSRAGWRIHPIFGTRKFHAGDDWAAPRGTRIPSRGAGKVIHTGRHRALGNYVDVKTGAYKFRYQHNDKNIARTGQMVKQGQTIGTVGSTGNSTGPHLHFEATKNGKFVAPKSLGFASGGLINQKGMYNLAEEGHPEFVIPTAPKRRTDAMKLLALAAKKVGGGNKRPNQLGNTNGGSGVFEQMLSALAEQTQMQAEQIALLTKLVLKDNNLYVDSNELGRAVAPSVAQTLSSRQGMKNMQGGRI